MMDIRDLRIWSLMRKELGQIGRNRRLVLSLLLPPIVMIVLFGFALNPDVRGLRLGVLDESRSSASRAVISALSESEAFTVRAYYRDGTSLGAALNTGQLDAGLVIPSDFAKRRDGGAGSAEIQLLIDAANANTAQIAGGYAARIVSAFNAAALETATVDATAISAGGGAGTPRGGATRVYVSLFYNPGLRNSWFITTGLLGTLAVLNASVVAAASMVKEKEAGTVEQLLMTPASAWEIIVAKMSPLFILLNVEIAAAIAVSIAVFGVPVRGSLVLLLCAVALCVLTGVAIGTVIATFTASQQQAQLIAFFVNPPIVLLSGALTPVEALPRWVQPLTAVNPVHHLAAVARSVMLKGAGWEVVYPNLLALVASAIVLVSISVWRFRRQLA